MALLWATIGGGLIGGAAMTAMMFLSEWGRYRVWEEPLLLMSSPLTIGLLSQFIVGPCTIVFGLISAALINHLNLGRWPALAVCIAAAAAVHVACVRLVFWNEWSDPADFLLTTTPFAQGAALVLWWRLSRT